MIEVLDKMNIELPSLKIGILALKRLLEAMTEKVSNRLGIEVFNIYGMTETGGVGTLVWIAKIVLEFTFGKTTTTLRLSTP